MPSSPYAVRRPLSLLLLLSVALSALVLATAAAPANAATLREGSKGAAVSCWQKKLRWVSLARPGSAVPLIGVSGTYGPSTTNATKAFQRATKMTADGVAGDRTQTQMSAELATAARDYKDEYASSLYYGSCSTPEPMVCRRANNSPYLRDNPNSSSRYDISYGVSIRCTKIDSGMSSQTAVLYLKKVGESGTNAKTVVRQGNLRQTAIDLSKNISAASGTYRAYGGVAINGNSKFMSVPGCARLNSSTIKCEWNSGTYTVR